jgi:uncharacterized membrane protein
LPGLRATFTAVDDRLQARLAVIAGILLYLLLPPKLTIGPIWLAPALAGALLIPLVALRPTKMAESRFVHWISIAVIAILNFFNIASVVLLVFDLLDPHAKNHAAVSALELLKYGALIWMTNVLVFALWFWEVDGLGPIDRYRHASANDFEEPDFLFPQMSIDRSRIRGIPENWKPMFIDYLYLSFTNALAVSPTDTMPLTRSAKMLMLSESIISFITVALILARSVNILS